MTLTTTVRIVDPLNPWQVFDFCRSLVGGDDSTLWSRDARRYRGGVMSYRCHPRQRLVALLSVDYGVDGPIPADTNEPGSVAACIEVVFDTGYTYRGVEGGCADLHRLLTGKLGAWLDERGADWWAQDEFTGDWHHRTPCPVTS